MQSIVRSMMDDDPDARPTAANCKRLLDSALAGIDTDTCAIALDPPHDSHVDSGSPLYPSRKKKRRENDDGIWRAPLFE